MTSSPHADAGTDSTQHRYCLNCDTPVAGPYCAQCGQSTRTTRLNYGMILRDGVRHFFGEGGSPLARTVAALFRSPGRVARDYVEGHRQAYTNPIKFVLLTMALSVLGLRIFFPEGLPIPEQSSETFIKLGILESMNTITRFTTNYSQITALIMLPVAALLLRLFFWGCGRNVSEHLAFVAYVYSMAELIKLPFAPLGMSGNIPLTFFFDFVLPVGLLAWGGIVFNGVSKRRGILGALGVHFCFTMIAAVLLYVAAFFMAYVL